MQLSGTVPYLRCRPKQTKIAHARRLVPERDLSYEIRHFHARPGQTREALVAQVERSVKMIYLENTARRGTYRAS